MTSTMGQSTSSKSTRIWHAREKNSLHRPNSPRDDRILIRSRYPPNDGSREFLRISERILIGVPGKIDIINVRSLFPRVRTPERMGVPGKKIDMIRWLINNKTGKGQSQHNLPTPISTIIRQVPRTISLGTREETYAFKQFTFQSRAE